MGIATRLARRIFRVPTYARQSQALRTLLSHSTPRRFFNLLVVETEFRLRRTRLIGRPYVLVIDPANVCNLRCPLCPTGILKPGRRGEMIPWETFTSIVDAAAPWAYKINLFNWGEPLLHPHIFDMIRYIRAKRIGTSMSTNFSVTLTDAEIEQIITSGLEFLCLSIDGATQDTYATYRRKGNLSLVTDNLKRLTERRRELGSKTPVIEWQFIPMKHNEHEQEEARRLAAELGADLFRCIPVGLPFESTNRQELQNQWFPVSVEDGKTAAGEEMSSNEQAQTACYYLYRNLIVNPDGKTSPCCVVYGEKTDFGDIARNSIDAEWNNEKYRSARAHYRRNGRVTTPTVCDRCDLFAKRTHYRPN